jgi:hypothetical protein
VFFELVIKLLQAHTLKNSYLHVLYVLLPDILGEIQCFDIHINTPISGNAGMDLQFLYSNKGFSIRI